MPEFTHIQPETVHQWIIDGEAVVIDVREAEELAQARLEEAVHAPMSSFDVEIIPVDTGKKVVFMCAHGLRSEQVGNFVVAQGILTQAYNMTGGLTAWAEAGLPLKPLVNPETGY
ncbi:MAG: rhodanese-like domain-containing protein [Rhodospirillales bacterium]|nr:rhodanese-like domain-containing protein [Rhodospirillales bacterium]